ncbi:DNA repair protein RecO [Candidatus Adlerbacteria bacterium RIFOXYC1_FULL_48_26]|uniref:DNA repair protein RecO n=1 Tax=Candidatus Adlerbacteria bacterium RIFOXYC1_FULL_48_26 TaxID=1797247 RepID=A0A1F4Y2M1_9BACT|nr:MAG: DNA repair protein RecO [Candidatus Adlerbacteria bacterium RIFOXYC1_FULL_48_26]OGC94422.1 MAG: DNA repair protein RecO [Candidatus Adlerbacteria bacterium RIFOXYB1_FULL_48_10]
MHDVISTRGIVLSKRTVGEANTLVSMLTEDLGVIRVSARSARLERSKLRYGLETLTQGTFSLVRGKYDWKLTGTQGLSRPFLHASIAQRKTAGKVSRLLIRLIQGEEPVRDLFEVIVHGLLHISQETNEENLPYIEAILVLRIVAQLGYVEEKQELGVFLNTHTFSEALIEQAKKNRPLLIRSINTSLAETGL